MKPRRVAAECQSTIDGRIVITGTSELVHEVWHLSMLDHVDSAFALGGSLCLDCSVERGAGYLAAALYRIRRWPLRSADGDN